MFDKITFDTLLNKMKNSNVVLRLIYLNISLYFFTSLDLISNFSEKWLYVPSKWQDFISIPYTLITYQFLHDGFFHLISNMIIVFFFGNIFIRLTHEKKIIPLYVLGGIFSGLFFFIFNASTSFYGMQTYTLVGASGSAMAILGAVASLNPNKEIVLLGGFRVKLKWIAFFFLFIDVIGLSTPNTTSNITHIGGLIFGYLFIRLSKEGYDLSKPFNDLLNQIISIFFKQKSPRVTYINDKFKNKKVFKQEPKPKETQIKIDAILDKISQSGYEKLSQAEKDFLFNNSKK